MVQKFCPACKDCIPVACKTCPCGHKFVKTSTSRDSRSKFEIEALTTTSRREDGRPRRKSAMNSLYYHSSLHMSSYKLARNAAAMSAKRRKVSDGTMDNTGTSNRVSSKLTGSRRSPSGSISSSNLDSSPRRKKGRPPKVDTSQQHQPRKAEIDPSLRAKFTDYMENSNSAGQSVEAEAKVKAGSKSSTDCESYKNVYKNLSASQRLHFSLILEEINMKYRKSVNFPLMRSNHSTTRDTIVTESTDSTTIDSQLTSLKSELTE